MQKIYFIVNPVSGSGRAKREFVKISSLLDERSVPYKVTFTEHPGHATELAKLAYAAGERLIASVGGDGTVNEVAAGLAETDAVLAVLPFGTGNDLSKVIPFATEPEDVVEELISGKVHSMDICYANDRAFINVAGLGFDAEVLINTEKHKKKLNGMLPYMLGILDTLAHLDTLELTLRTRNETIETKSIVVSIGNGQYIGGGMRDVPTGDPFDGLMDVYYIDRVSVLRFLTLLPQFIKGKHTGNPVVHHVRTDYLEIASKKPALGQLDGEVWGGTPVIYRMSKGGINILLPANADIKE